MTDHKKYFILRLAWLSLSFATILLFQNCGEKLSTTNSSSTGGLGTPTPTPTPTPNPTPASTCPRTTNADPIVNSLSLTSLTFNSGMGRDAGTDGTKSLTATFNSGDTYSGVVSLNCKSTPQDSMGLTITCNDPSVPTASGSSNITVAAGNNSECASGSVTVNVSVTDAIVAANNSPLNACSSLAKTSANQNLTINLVNACLPTQRVNPPTPYVTGQMGRTVAIDNDWAIAVAPGDEDRAIDAGAAYIYHRVGTTWNLTQKIIPSTLAAGNLLTGAGISGTTLALGAPLANSSVGVAWVYQFNGTTWAEVKTLTPPTNGGGLFGAAIAVSGTTVVVGTPRANLGAGVNSGAAYVFSGASWATVTTLSPSGGANLARGEFGTSLSMSGSVLAVGAPFPSSIAAREEAVYIFNNGAPVNKISNTVGTIERFGFSVSLDGANLLVGAPYKTSERGIAYLFQNTNVASPAQATRQYVHSDPNQMDVDHFGYSVALKGTRVLVSSPDKAESTPKYGAVYLFASGATTQLFKIRARAADRGADSFGYSIAVSSDGWLLSGALNDEHVVGIDNSGSAYFIGLPN